MLVNWEYMGPIVWVELSASNPSDSFAGYEYVARSHISHEGGGIVMKGLQAGLVELHTRVLCSL